MLIVTGTLEPGSARPAISKFDNAPGDMSGTSLFVMSSSAAARPCNRDRVAFPPMPSQTADGGHPRLSSENARGGTHLVSRKLDRRWRVARDQRPAEREEGLRERVDYEAYIREHKHVNPASRPAT